MTHTAGGYYSFVRFLHWSITILVAIQIISASVMPEVRSNTSPTDILNLHMTFGVVLLPFVFAFFLTHFYRPGIPKATTPVKFEKIATVAHYILYMLLILVPLTGWTYASVHGWTVTVFGSVTLPQLFATSSSFGRMLADFHGPFAGLLSLLIVGHIGAALYHHYILKDDVLKHMLPHRQ